MYWVPLEALKKNDIREAWKRLTVPFEN